MTCHKVILPLLVLVAILSHGSNGQMDSSYVIKYIVPRCYSIPNFDQYADGQKQPLSHTLQSFLGLLEKLEDANPDMSLKDESFLLLQNFTFENALTPVFKQWEPSDSSELYNSKLKFLLESEKIAIVNHENPYTDEEICSLYFMLSHTVNTTKIDDDINGKWRTPEPNPVNEPQGMRRAPENTKMAREQGVVAIEMSEYAVSLSRVITGIYVGLKENRIINSDNMKESFRTEKFQWDGGVPKHLDPLYMLTLADIFAYSAGDDSVDRKRRIGENGQWDGVRNTKTPDVRTDKICPTIYRLPEDNTGPYTYSTVRGGIDGILLGSIIKTVADNDKDVKLSQVLRMYYSQRGIQAHSTNHQMDQQVKKVSFCRRIELVKEHVNEINSQIGWFYLFTTVFLHEEAYLTRKTTAQDNFHRLLDNSGLNIELSSCAEVPSVTNPEKLPCDTPTDIIAIMDTTTEYYIEKQQNIIGYLANNLRVGNINSTITILTDQRNGTDFSLKFVVNKSSSSGCAACKLTQSEIVSGSRSEEDFVIQAVDRFLVNLKEEQENANGVPGKVIIFFNFNEEAPTSSRASRINKVLTDLRLRHPEITVLAVGKSEKILKNYARNNKQDAVQLTDEEPDVIAAALTKRICLGPASLQYNDCAQRRNEDSAVYEGVVTPLTLQHWFMHPTFFEKSLTAKVFFDVDPDDNIKVCHSKASFHPELVEKNCQQTNSTHRRLEFMHTNPCQGFLTYNCAPFYFTVIGLEDNGNNRDHSQKYCTSTPETKCKRLDQVKFKVKHEGIRCSGCFGLSASILLVFTALLYTLFSTNA